MSLYEMLPPNYHSAYVKDFQDAVDGEVEKARNAKDDLLRQLNVRTSTWGLDLWEKAYGIETDVSKSYAFRRSRIESKMRSQGITTVAMIKNVSESYSNGQVDIIERPAEYRFDVKFIGTVGIPPNMADLTAAIEEIKPAHLAYAYIYTFITWDNVEAYNHTWDEWDTLNLMWNEFEVYKEE